MDHTPTVIANTIRVHLHGVRGEGDEDIGPQTVDHTIIGEVTDEMLAMIIGKAFKAFDCGTIECWYRLVESDRAHWSWDYYDGGPFMWNVDRVEFLTQRNAVVPDPRVIERIAQEERDARWRKERAEMMVNAGWTREGMFWGRPGDPK